MLAPVVRRLPRRVQAQHRFFVYDNCCASHKCALRRFPHRVRHWTFVIDRTHLNKTIKDGDIYHRDHWIVIVHMATWKDFTKWNEKNTIIDWIDHMGKIVKRVFPVPSCLRAFSAKAMRLKKLTCYTMYYLLPLYIKSQTSGTRLCLAVLG